jgi:hypothetical protein
MGELQEKLLSTLMLRDSEGGSNVNAFEYVLIKVHNLEFAYRLLRLTLDTPNIPLSNLFAVMELYYSRVIEIQDENYMEQYFKPYGYGIFEDMPNFNITDFQKLKPALVAAPRPAALSLAQPFTPVPIFPPLRKVGLPQPSENSLPPTPNPLVPLPVGTQSNDDDEDSPLPLALAPPVAPVTVTRRSARANSDPVLLALKALRTAANSSNISKLSSAITSANAIGPRVTDTNAYIKANRKLTQLTKQAANSARNAREFQVARMGASNDENPLEMNDDDNMELLPGATMRREALKRMNEQKKKAMRRPPGARGYTALAVEPTEPPPAAAAPLGKNWDPFKNWVKFGGVLGTRRKHKKPSRKYRHKHVTRSTMKHRRRR